MFIGRFRSDVTGLSVEKHVAVGVHLGDRDPRIHGGQIKLRGKAQYFPIAGSGV